jgi:hypothetical protein
MNKKIWVTITIILLTFTNINFSTTALKTNSSAPSKSYENEVLDNNNIDSTNGFDLNFIDPLGQCSLFVWWSPHPFEDNAGFLGLKYSIWNHGKDYPERLEFSVNVSFLYSDYEDFCETGPFSVKKVDSGCIMYYSLILPYALEKPETIKFELLLSEEFKNKDKNLDDNTKTVGCNPGVTVYGQVYDKDNNPIYAHININHDVPVFTLTSLFGTDVGYTEYGQYYFCSAPKNKDTGSFRYTMTVDTGTRKKIIVTEPLAPYDVENIDIKFTKIKNKISYMFNCFPLLQRMLNKFRFF